MAYSRVSYVASAGQTNFGVTFPYLLQAHVSVTVNGVNAAFTWFNAATITLTTPASLSDAVEVSRSSNRAARLNDYNDGSVLTENVMDTDGNQTLYIAQEAIDISDALSIRVDGLALGGIAPLAANISNAATGNLVGITVQAALNELDTEKLALAGGTMTGALVLAADPAAALQSATKQYVDASVFPGFVGINFAAATPSGWLNLQGGTIGNAASGGSVRANADTVLLFTYLYTNLSDTLAPVSGGRGASAAADFAANKTITLPDWRNRSPVGAGQSTVVEAFNQAAVNTGTDNITVASNDRKWISAQQVVFNILTGSITGAGITNGATLWVIRTGATTIKLASSLANAQNGTAIDITAVGGASTFTMVATFTSRTVGEAGGEEYHAMSSTELLSHATPGTNTATAGVNALRTGDGAGTTTATSPVGGNAAMNVLNPFYAVNWIIKL